MEATEFIESRCDAARNILEQFGPEKAMGYLIGEKFLNFLEVAETNAEWRQAIPAFVTEIKEIFVSGETGDEPISRFASLRQKIS